MISVLRENETLTGENSALGRHTVAGSCSALSRSELGGLERSLQSARAQSHRESHLDRERGFWAFRLLWASRDESNQQGTHTTLRLSTGTAQ